MASRFGRVAALILSMAGVIGFFPAALFAATSDLLIANWKTQHGLPSNKVTSVVQTQDGYVWFGTNEGLVRFDGVKFTLFDSSRVELWHDHSITALYETPDGVLWIGHVDGAVSHLSNGVFATIPPRDDGTLGKIQALGGDAAGDVWAMDTAGNLARMRDGLTLQPERGGTAGLAEMTCSATGTIWVTVGGRVSALQDASLRTIPLRAEMQGYVHGVGAARDGGLWVAAKGRVWKWSGEGWSEDLGPVPSGYAGLHVLYETHDGQLLGGSSDHGLAIIVPGDSAQDEQLRRSSGFGTDWVSAVCEDHEGGIWLGSGSSGLFRFQEKKVTMLVPPDAWQGRSVLGVTTARQGGLWVGTEGAGLYRFRDNAWTCYGLGAGLRNQYVWSVCEDVDGVPWFGTWVGLHTWVDDRIMRAPGADGVSLPIMALLPSAGGGLWIGSRNGLAYYHEGALHWTEPEATRQLRDVRAILEEPDGTLWVGSNGDGLGVIRNGQVRQFRRSDGLSSDFVQCLHRDDDGTLWIGTRGGGLNRWQHGIFASVTVAQGLVDGSICHIEDDGRGYFWMSSHGGIMRVSRKELNACADGTLAQVNCLSYGVNDGLLTIATAGAMQPAGGTLPDGQLFFSTDSGVAVIDPSRVRVNPHAPPVSIESLRVGDRVVPAGVLPAGPIRIGPGDHRIEIKYTGLSFAAPEKVQFKRRLEGLEPDWVAVGGERLAVYNYVPPGRYVFHVTAANNDNVWNAGGRSLEFIVLPHFWQTTWFRVLMLAALLLATGGMVWVQARRRLHRRVERLEREQAIEVERTRIANDMHDDLGSHLTRITMLSETARAEQGDPERAGEGLRQIYETARGMTRAMDEIVWAVNPKHDTLESLVYYFEKFAQDLVGAAGMRCRLDMPAEIPGWRPSSEVRHNLFLAYKEALHNTVRHSGADTVTVALAMSEAGCEVTVRDDGRGLNENGSAAEARGADGRISAGHGFANMRERLIRIGGTCEIRSAPGQGCVVVLFAPAHPGGLTSPAGR